LQISRYQLNDREHCWNSCTTDNDESINWLKLATRTLSEEIVAEWP